jgi:hypothetical protein
MGGVIIPKPKTASNRLFPGLAHDQFVYIIINAIRKAIRLKKNDPSRRILSNLPRRALSGLSVENVFHCFHNICIWFMMLSL